MNGRELALERFGDGVELPRSAIKPFDSGTPQLDDVYPRALIARAAGQPYVHVLASGDNRPWAMTVTAFGIRGLVVRRFSQPATAQDLKNGRPIDSGVVSQLLVRFAVIDVLLAHKRAYLKSMNSQAGHYTASRKRPRLSRNVSIR